MKKIQKVWILVVLSIVVSVSLDSVVLANGGDEYGESYNTVAEPLTFKCDYYKKEATLVGVDSSVKNLVIPETYDGCVVNQISIALAYWDHLTIGSVFIPCTVETIGERSFEDSSNLKSVIFEDGSKLKKLEYGVFKNCENLEKVVLAEGIEEIGAGAFSECISLQNVNMPDSIRVIGDSAFDGCWKLSDVKLGDNVEEVGAYAFRSCNLTTINIPSGIKSIREGAFCACDNLQSVSGVMTNLPTKVFYGCSSLNSINIKENVTQIGPDALGKTGLRSVVIPASVKVIESGAFDECEQLEKIFFQSDPISIEYKSISANSKVSLYGCYGGTVESFAHDNGLRFVGYDKVDNVSAKYKNGTVQILWDELDGISEYKVYRKTGVDGEFELIDTTNELSYTDSNVEREKTYYYVIAVDHVVDGVEIKDVRSKMVTLKMPKATVKPTVKKSADNKSVTVTWKKDVGAKFYTVYRSESANGLYKKIGKTTKTLYTDKKIERGKTYYYAVGIDAKTASLKKSQILAGVGKVGIPEATITASKITLTVGRGQKTSVRIKYLKNGTLNVSSQNEGVASAGWKDGWDGDYCTLYVYGNKKGTTKLVLTNSADKEKCYITVKVK